MVELLREALVFEGRTNGILRILEFVYSNEQVVPQIIKIYKDVVNRNNNKIMELNEFVAHFAEQFEETDQSLFAPETKFRELEEWSSLLALSIIAMVNEEYDVIIKGDEMKKANTIDELYEMVKAKL